MTTLLLKRDRISSMPKLSDAKLRESLSYVPKYWQVLIAKLKANSRAGQEVEIEEVILHTSSKMFVHDSSSGQESGLYHSNLSYPRMKTKCLFYPTKSNNLTALR